MDRRQQRGRDSRRGVSGVMDDEGWDPEPDGGSALDRRDASEGRRRGQVKVETG